MRSLQARLSTGLIVAMAVLMVLLIAVGGYSLRHLIVVFLSERLQHDMDALLTQLEFDAQGRPVLDTLHLAPVFRQPYSGHYFKIRTGDHILRSRSLWDTDLELPPTTTTAIVQTFIDGPIQQQLLLVARRFIYQGRPVIIGISEDFTPLVAGLRRIVLTFISISLLGLLLLILVQQWIVHRELRPLETIRRDLLRLDRGEIRQLDTDMPAELSPLVAQINRLIQVMEQRLQRSRHALGNLAHALKTPLTVIAQLAHQQAGETGRTLEKQSHQIEALMQRELKRARIAGASRPGQRIVLAREVDDLTATLKMIYQRKALNFICRIPPDSQFPGDRDDMLELLGNLLDNACQWADSDIRLTVEDSNGYLKMTVEDDGPGCPPNQLDQLTRRGQRIDESRSGHGLGLAIVSDIIDLYGGRLDFGRSAELGGFLAATQIPFTAAEDSP